MYSTAGGDQINGADKCVNSTAVDDKLRMSNVFYLRCMGFVL